MRKFSFSLFSKLPAHEFRITYSTLLTLARFIITPCIVTSMFWGKWGTACILFVVASLTDLFDGMVARLCNQKTFLGAVLDPLADKFLLVSCFTTLALTTALPFPVPYWFVLLVLIRELIIVAGFVYIYYAKSGINVEPTRLGKITTTLQMLFIMWLFACYFYGWVPAKTYYFSLYTITALVIISFIQYAKIGINYYRNGRAS